MVAQPGEEYEVLELVGRGSFGQIHKVRRKRDGHILARKEISYVRMSQKEKDQLNAEFSILSRLQHPNIVQYYSREHNRQDQSLYLYMEYCGGGDLAARIKVCRAEGTLVPEQVVWTVFTQIVLALYKCHNGADAPAVGNSFGEQGKRKGLMRAVSTGREVIVHRDLKPENVFLDHENSVKLGDFGLSKLLASDQHLATTYVGTPYYMSPEIVCDLPYTSRSDIWSLGCVIYELCRLAPPFNANTHLGLCQKIKDGRYPPIPPQYSPELRRVIDSCLKINPAERPDTGKLLELDVMRLMRREMEATEIMKSFKSRETMLKLKEKDLDTREQSFKVLLNEEGLRLKVQIDAELRLEWQAKADAEIKRRVSIETKMLFENYEREMKLRFDEAVRHQREHDRQKWNDEQLALRMNNMNVMKHRAEDPCPSVSITSACSDSTNTHSSLASTAPSTAPPASPPRSDHFLGQGENFAPPSPMDISMSSPMPGHASHFNHEHSPLQARRTQSNLYNMIRSSASPLDDDDDDEDEDEDDEEIDGRPAPLRNVKRPVRPFLRQQSAPIIPRKNAGDRVSIKPPTTPTRRSSGNAFGQNLQKNAGLENRQTSPTRRQLFKNEAAVGVKAALLNNNSKRAKSIVDIAKERNGGKERGKENTYEDEAPVWNEAMDVEMPSPFLSKVRRNY